MSFPTTQWGNLYDVYTTVPGPTPSAPSSSDGPVLGNVSLLADGSLVQFMQFVTSTSTAANAALIISGNANLYKVTSSTAANQLVIAVNDLSGGSTSNNNTSTSGGVVTLNYCGWVKRKGLAFPLVAASVGATAIVASSSTLGQLYAATAGTDLQGNIVNTVVVGGSNAVSPVFMS